MINRIEKFYEKKRVERAIRKELFDRSKWVQIPDYGRGRPCYPLSGRTGRYISKKERAYLDSLPQKTYITRHDVFMWKLVLLIFSPFILFFCLAFSPSPSLKTPPPAPHAEMSKKRMEPSSKTHERQKTRP